MLLRLAAAISAIAYGIDVFKVPGGIEIWVSWVSGTFAIVVGVLLLIGLLTPIAAAAAGLGYLVEGVWSTVAVDIHRPSHFMSTVDLAAISIALICLGPGAFSLDALLFGRREIIIPDGSRRPPS